MPKTRSAIASLPGAKRKVTSSGAVGPPPRLARTVRLDGRIEAFRRLEVGRVRLLRVDLDRLDAVDEKDALLALLVAPADQAPGAAAEGKPPGIDIAFAALARLSFQVRRRFVPDVDPP